jgi:hypothetical protein
MNVTELASDLAGRIRAEGARSNAVILGLQLTVAVWNAVDPADIDAQLRWGLAAIGARGILDTLDPLPAHRVDVPTDQVPATAAAAVADLLTAVADAFATAHSDRLVWHPAAWYRDAEQQLRDAATALS